MWTEEKTDILNLIKISNKWKHVFLRVESQRMRFSDVRIMDNRQLFPSIPFNVNTYKYQSDLNKITNLPLIT